MSSIERFIETVKKYPILYDTTHPDYKDGIKKDKVWNDVIGKQMNSDGEELKKRWKNLKDTYAKHLRSIKTTMKKDYKNWRWAKHMQSFKPHLIKTRGSTRNIDTSSKRELLEFENQAQNIEDTFSESLESFTELKNAPYEESTENVKMEPEIEDEVDDADFQNETNVDQKSMNFDGIELIFLGYARTIKAFSARRQAMIKLKMAQIIAEEELQHIEEGS